MSTSGRLLVRRLDRAEALDQTSDGGLRRGDSAVPGLPPEAGQAVPHLLDLLRRVSSGARCITDDGRCEVVTQSVREFNDVPTSVLGIEVVGRCAEAEDELNRTPEPMRRFFDCSPEETRVEHDGFDIGVEPHAAVDVRLNALVEIVESGLVCKPTQVRQQHWSAHVYGLQHGVREAEGCNAA